MHLDTTRLRAAVRPRWGVALGACLWLASASASAQEFVPGAEDRTGWPGFSRVSIGFNGGFQYWTLSNLEEALLARHESFAEDGFNLIDPSFGVSYSFGVDVQYRFSEAYFFRVATDWTRLSFDERDRRTIAFLGGGDRTPVSFSYTSRVETRPLLISLGLGRALHSRAVRWGFTANAVLAPVKVRDEFSLFIEEQFDSAVEATGFGIGFESTISADYLTESNMTLYLEAFFRAGSTDVELETNAWESTVVPGTRGVNFGGGGLRLGFRFA